nr:MFS transporter [Actinomycetota bacterium]
TGGLWSNIPMAQADRTRAAPGPRAAQRDAARAIRPLWAQIYLPNLVIATGQGAMLPILVYAAREVHGSSAAGAVVVALNGFGTLAFDIPAGQIVARLGEWVSGWVAACLLSVGVAGCLLARSVPELAAGVVVQAAGSALWNLVRLTHLSRAAPVLARGRALSLFGGVIRAGNVLGPFAFIAVASHRDVRPAFAVYLAAVAIGLVWTVLARDRHDAGGREPTEPIRPLAVLSRHRAGFATSGAGAIALSLLRGSRNAIIPLWAAHLGLGSHSAASLFAFSSVVDLALFYPAGVLSDRLGRRAVLVPSLVLLAIGHFLVPLTHAYATLFAASFVLALGNGLGAGILMTLGADLTPSEGRASFLAVWRCLVDGGTTLGPLVESGVIALGALALAGPAVGALGLLGVLAAVKVREPAHVDAARSSRATARRLARDAARDL